ncbi:MAG TPA: XdhC family protein [Oligoflexus sp.]|uniref:XdhC family protein n=1 Tax=Oligoflexus sp. TaxID=1971216 RepID=UPI002D5DE743|nr:XdhC family protein [Oligoflexus sp.]HYX36929.1 XdhC family protein [Oligoflexus sp.]
MLTSPPELFRKAQVLKDSGASFVIATVVRVRGSASAKTGSKALFNDQGVNLYGYIGGGCAESHVSQEACEALQEKRPRIVEIDLDDEVFGLMPCGGVMDVYLEPHFSSPVIPLPNFGSWNAGASQFLRELGFQSEFSADPVTPLDSWRTIFLQLAQALAIWKGYPLEPLRNSKGWGAAPLPDLTPAPAALLVFGQTRITEEFSRILQFLDWKAQVFRNTPLDTTQPHLQVCELPMDVEAIEIPAGSWVVIASHHKQDAAIAEHALRSGADYVALVASEKRSRLIVADLVERHLPSQLLHNFCAPAGLNMPTDTPLQIAFSILCEILWAQNLAPDSTAMLYGR